jgi:predicted metalloprotease
MYPNRQVRQVTDRPRLLTKRWNRITNIFVLPALSRIRNTTVLNQPFKILNNFFFIRVIREYEQRSIRIIIFSLFFKPALK